MSEDLLRQFGIDDEDALNKEFEWIIRNKYGQPIRNMALGHIQPVTEKYRKNTIGGRIATDVEFAGGFENPAFMLRRYRDNAERDFESDHELHYRLYKLIEEDTKDIKDHRFTAGSLAERKKIAIVLRPLSYGRKFFTGREISLTDHSKIKTLDKRLRGGPKQPFWEFLSYLDPLIYLHDRIPKFENKIPALKTILSEKVLGKEDYMANFLKIMETSVKIPSEGKKSLIDGFGQLVDHYMLDPEFATLIQADGYPWHNDSNAFLDLGKLKKGSRLLHLGCLLGHPSTFNYINDPKRNLYTILIETYGMFKRGELDSQFSIGLPKLDPVMLENGFYFGAICANVNAIVEFAGCRCINSEELNDYEETINSQLELLVAKEIEHAQTVANGLYNAFAKYPMSGWRYFENLRERMAYEDKQRIEAEKKDKDKK